MRKKILAFVKGCMLILGFFSIAGAICGFLYEIFMMGFRLI